MLIKALGPEIQPFKKKHYSISDNDHLTFILFIQHFLDKNRGQKVLSKKLFDFLLSERIIGINLILFGSKDAHLHAL